MEKKVAGQGPLTDEEKSVLANVRGDSYPTGKEDVGTIVLIGKKTCDELAETFHLDTRQGSYLQKEDPVNFIFETTSELLGSFFKDGEGTGTKVFAKQMKDWVNKSFPNALHQDNTPIRNAATMGASLALNAFRIQFGFEFVDNLRKVNPREITDTINH